MNRMLAGPEDWSQRGVPIEEKPKAVFSGARRHSRRVRFLRKAVPVTLILVAVGLVAVNYLNPMRWLRVPTEFGTLVISGSKITMEAPRLAGFTKERREYEVSASAASQDTRNPHFVEMKEISGRMGMQDDSTVSLTAVEGVYDIKGDLLTLTQEIVIMSTAGYQGRLTEAKVEIKKGRIVSEKPVQLKMPQGTLDANRMEVIDSGELIRFEGGVVMMLAPDAVNKGVQGGQPATPQAQANAK